jgi:predicted TPR repeat methyltransferase
MLQAHFGKATVLQEMGEGIEKVSEALHRALELGTNVPEIHQQFGRLFMRSGDKQALDAFENALRLNPDLKEGDRNLGYAYLRFGNTTGAQKHLRRALKKDPADVFSRFYLAIAEGKEPDDELRNSFVEKEFDSFASSFEKTLIQNLGYDVPAKIKTIIEDFKSTGVVFDSVADLGCGTGLMGELLIGAVGRVVGIDISANMLANAREKGCYDELVQGDIVDVLSRMDSQFDCFIATDVVMYFGELEGLIRAVLHAAKPGALFVFSTEKYDGEGYVLQDTGRYAHGTGYLHDLSARFGCVIVSQEGVNVRKEWHEWITGEIFVLRLP